MPDPSLNLMADWISSPGETVADLLAERSWTQADFAERTGFTTKHVSLLIGGKAPITEDTALRLERVLGSTARFWLTREAQYREGLARAEEMRSLENEASWLKELPLSDMTRLGWVKRCSKKGQQVADCLAFFGVASVSAWRTRYGNPIAAFRASKKFSLDPGSVAAWLRQGERSAEKVSCRPFNKQAFRSLLGELRGLTNESDPEVFQPGLVVECAKVGVAVVIEPAPRRCPLSGATKWLSPEKALLMLSLRHKSNDHLWFSFFHEAGHLLSHGKKMMFLEFDGELSDEHEREADVFASDLLISPKDVNELRVLPHTRPAIVRFAKKIGVAPGIVVGRMQKDGLLPWTHLNGLKVRYRWAHENQD